MELSKNRFAMRLRSLWQRIDLYARGFGVSPIVAQQLFESFRTAGAVTPERAQPVHLHSMLEDYAFGSLLRLGVFREPTRGRYYLDEGSLEQCRRGLPL